MNKGKLDRVIFNLALSIRYARLKEEYASIEQKKLELIDKKSILGGKERKIDKSNQHGDIVTSQIESIEANYNASDYMLVINNEIKSVLERLSKRKDFAFVKYNVALNIVQDDFKYIALLDTDFDERISSLLFEDKQRLKRIEEDYKYIQARLHGIVKRGYLESATTLAAKLPIGELIKTAISSPSQAAAVVGASAFDAINSHFNKKKKAKKLSALSVGHFSQRLVISAMNLLFASKHFESEVEYKSFFTKELKKINFDRSIVMKELFEAQYDIEENRSKLELLHNLDDYLVEQIDLFSKKRSKG